MPGRSDADLTAKARQKPADAQRSLAKGRKDERPLLAAGSLVPACVETSGRIAQGIFLV